MLLRSHLELLAPGCRHVFRSYPAASSSDLLLEPRSDHNCLAQSGALTSLYLLSPPTHCISWPSLCPSCKRFLYHLRRVASSKKKQNYEGETPTLFCTTLVCVLDVMLSSQAPQHCRPRRRKHNKVWRKYTASRPASSSAPQLAHLTCHMIVTIKRV